MERTKKPKRDPLKDELFILLNTIHHVSKHLPGCEELRPKYSDYKTPSFQGDITKEKLKEIKHDVRISIARWMRATADRKIVETVKRLPPASRTCLRSIMPYRYKNFFNSGHRGFNKDFAAPTIFLVMNRRDKWVPLVKPLTRKRGLTTIKMKGNALKSEDGKTTLALLLLLGLKKLDWSDIYVHYRTTRLELTKTLLKKHPYARHVQDAIWTSLERLRGCVLSLVNEKGHHRISGILHEAIELEEDSEGYIDIFLSRKFVELVEDGYISLDPEIYLKLPAVEANLYAYLMRQLTFNQKKYLDPVSIDKVYDAAGLGGVHPEKKKRWEKLRTVRRGMEGLKSRGVVKVFDTEDYKLKVRSKDIVESEGEPALKPISELEQEQEQQNRCPRGLVFGKDFDDDNPDCWDCAHYNACDDENLRMKNET